ncbi:MAG: Holliday junction resolvase RuvX [Actinobacteria bacterium]|nr:Holliday junction resolvase RuvX [Actinomycetota bacterium]
MLQRLLVAAVVARATLRQLVARTLQHLMKLSLLLGRKPQPSSAHSAEIVRVLGIDLGSKRIGIAASDRSGTIASPLTVLQRSTSQRIDHVEIAKIVKEEEAQAVVIGLPLNMDGSEGSAAKSARMEADRMATVVNVPIYIHDERRSTVVGDRVLMERGLNAQDRRKVIDKVAAAVILQSWLDSGCPGVSPGE